MLDKLNSTNGYFTDGVYNGCREFHFTAKSTVDAGTNAVTKTLKLLDEAGNSSFPGKITASSLSAHGNGIYVMPVNSDSSKFLNELRLVAFTGELFHLRGVLTDLDVTFCVSNGNSIELPLPYWDFDYVGIVQYLLCIRAVNSSSGTFYGSTLRLVSVPKDGVNANVNIINLGATTNTGYTLAAGVKKVTIKASSGIRVNGGFVPLVEGEYN